MFHYKIRQMLSVSILSFSLACVSFLSACPHSTARQPIACSSGLTGWQPKHTARWERLPAARLGRSLRLGGGGGGGSRPAGRGGREERVLDGLGCGGGGVKAGYRRGAPCGRGGGRDQANGVAGEQREVLE